jgi:hypothetical protein
MKVQLPENISEITLGQFQRYQELITRDIDLMNFTKRKISIFTKIPFKDLANVRATDFERLSKQIDIALDTPASFQNRFKLNNIEFGFITDFDEITAGEFADIEKYQDGIENLNKVMAVLFRPVIKKEGIRYEIESYAGTKKYAEILKEMPLSIVNGALVFFLNLANELEDYTQKYLIEA